MSLVVDAIVMVHYLSFRHAEDGLSHHCALMNTTRTFWTSINLSEDKYRVHVVLLHSQLHYIIVYVLLQLYHFYLIYLALTVQFSSEKYTIRGDNPPELMVTLNRQSAINITFTVSTMNRVPECEWKVFLHVHMLCNDCLFISSIIECPIPLLQIPVTTVVPIFIV